MEECAYTLLKTSLLLSHGPMGFINARSISYQSQVIQRSNSQATTAKSEVPGMCTSSFKRDIGDLVFIIGVVEAEGYVSSHQLPKTLWKTAADPYLYAN